jgi:uncharacterized protein (DUF433 family)
MSTATERQHIEIRQGAFGPKPCIAGHRIRVEDIYIWHELHGWSADEIVQEFPQITLGDVYAALAYFFDHREEMLERMREGDEFVKRMQAEAGPSLLERFRERFNGDSVPS